MQQACLPDMLPPKDCLHDIPKSGKGYNRPKPTSQVDGTFLEREAQPAKTKPWPWRAATMGLLLWSDLVLMIRTLTRLTSSKQRTQPSVLATAQSLCRFGLID